MDEPKVGRRKGKDKARDTFEKYGKNTTKGVRAKERVAEQLAQKVQRTKVNNSMDSNAGAKK